jgi:hypothetical protein
MLSNFIFGMGRIFRLIKSRKWMPMAVFWDVAQCSLVNID